MAAVFEGMLEWFPRRCPPTAAGAHSIAATPAADGVDRISALPDDLLRDVVSRLPVRDGARTAALASRWRGLWRSAPLVLRDADLRLPPAELEPARAAAAVGRALADHPGPFRTVHLTHFSLASLERERDLAEWARLLAGKGVQDLALLNDSDPIRGRRLPADILRCASLCRLFLGSWTFPDTVGDEVFPHLKELRIFGTDMSDGYLDHMLASSPELEVLSLIVNIIPKRICLRGGSLQCTILWMSAAGELAVVDAPRLVRLVLWITAGTTEPMNIKIDRAPELRVLGYLEPRVHKLQIANVVINAETKASPSSIVPSVKILALKANFGVFKEVNMLPSFLRCFPNIDTLHIESAIDGEATGRHHAKFWRKAHPIQCLKSTVEKFFIHKFREDRSEFEFLKFIAKHAKKLQALVLVLTREKFASAEEADKITHELGAIGGSKWAADKCLVLLVGPKVKNVWSFRRASDLSVRDPFM
ncbi:putative FBD-associated F-box protein [Panicum miliaceum]|uniref:FBD-associated F-box protein n=1 Tax=Panicum miliaceum TaxID=4540 RepID=A0A3L6SSV6_PANMI|nr:putative FBD-associated F-box protein [Panicum miliaceum]